MAAEPLTFTIADIPPSGDNEPITSADLECEVCGVPLSYGGRGRKPRFCDEHKPTRNTSGAPRRSARDVESAMAALDAAHTSLSFLLMLLAGDAAVAWEDQRPALDDRNRKILEMDPRLAKRLATAAAKGGAPSLVLSHLIAVAPAAGIAYGKIRAARQDKPTSTSEPTAYPQGVDNVVDLDVKVDPDAAFKRRS